MPLRNFTDSSVTVNKTAPKIFVVFKYRNSYSYLLSDGGAVKAVKLLYQGCTIALDRKLRKALDMIDEYERTKGRW